MRWIQASVCTLLVGAAAVAAVASSYVPDPASGAVSNGYRLNLFTSATGWAQPAESDQVVISEMDPKDADRPEAVRHKFRRVGPGEGVVAFEFYAYAQADWARAAFANSWRPRFDRYGALPIPGLRSARQASADGRSLLWGYAVAGPKGEMGSYEMAVLDGARILYGRADFTGLSPEAAAQILANMRQAATMYLAYLHGEPTTTAAEEARPVLDLQAAPQPLAADGEAQIVALLTEKSGQQVRPLAGRTLQFELIGEGGPVVGRLTGASAVTDAAGRARIAYVAPSRDAMPKGAVPRASVRVSAANPAVSDILRIDLDNSAALTLTAEHAILPAQPGFDNQLHVRFDAPRGERGREYRAVLRCTSDGGRLSSLAGGAGQRTLELKLASGVDNTLLYRWDGPSPQGQAVAETVTVEIPDLKRRADTSFSVGLDLMLESVRLSWKGPFYPGMVLPVEAVLVDRFHPNADLAALLAEHKIEPALTLKQKSYTPLPLGSTLGDRFLANLVHGVAGATIPHGSIIHDLPIAEVRRSKDGRWLMSAKAVDLKDAFPQVMPNDLGNYLFEAHLDPRLPGDPGEELHTASFQVEVREIPPEEEMVFTFALPTLQAMAAYSPLKAGGLAWTVASHLHEGNPVEAARELGKAYLMPVANSYLADKAKKLGVPVAKALMAELRERLPAASYAKLEAAIARETAALDQPWAQGMIEQFDLDMVEQTVGAITDGVEGWAAEKAGIAPRASLWRWSLISDAVAAPVPPGLHDAARFFQDFLAGNGRYGVLVVSRRGLSDLSATDAAGRAIPLQERAQLFDRLGRHGLLLPNVAVIPFVRGEQFRVTLRGDGSASVKVFKVLADGIGHGQLGGDGQPWEKSLQVDGTRGR